MIHFVVAHILLWFSPQVLLFHTEKETTERKEAEMTRTDGGGQCTLFPVNAGLWKGSFLLPALG